MKPDDKIAAIIQNNAFVQMLAQLGAGRVATECAEKFARVVEAVKLTGKKGELVIKLTIKPESKGEVQTVDVKDDITPKLPERDKRPTTFFLVGEHDLSRTDPNQTELKFPDPAAKAAAGK